VTEIDLAYYAKEFAYVVTFSDNCYSVIPSNPHLSEDLLEKIWRPVELDENLVTYLDLETERESQQRHALLKKIVITSLLMAKSNWLSTENLLKQWNEMTEDNLEFPDVERAVEELLVNEVVERKGDENLSLCAVTDRTGEGRAALFRELLSGEFFLASLGLPLYDELIDESLLRVCFKVALRYSFSGRRTFQFRISPPLVTIRIDRSCNAPEYARIHRGKTFTSRRRTI